MSLVGLLVALLVVVLICYVLTLLPVDGKIVRILQIVVLIIFIAWALGGVFGAGPVIRVD